MWLHKTNGRWRHLVSTILCTRLVHFLSHSHTIGGKLVHLPEASINLDQDHVPPRQDHLLVLLCNICRHGRLCPLRTAQRQVNPSINIKTPLTIENAFQEQTTRGSDPRYGATRAAQAGEPTTIRAANRIDRETAKATGRVRE